MHDYVCPSLIIIRLWLFCRQDKNLDYFQENNEDKKSDTIFKKITKIKKVTLFSRK